MINHVSFIPDGNRRWSKNHEKSYREGYKEGANRMIEVAEWCIKEGISALSGFILSKNNMANRTYEQLGAVHEAAIYFCEEVRSAE